MGKISAVGGVRSNINVKKSQEVKTKTIAI